MSSVHIFLAKNQLLYDYMDRCNDICRQVLSLGVILHVAALSAHDKIQKIEHHIFL